MDVNENLSGNLLKETFSQQKPLPTQIFLNGNPPTVPIGHLLTWNLYLAELFSVGIFLNGLTFGNLEIPQSAVC